MGPQEKFSSQFIEFCLTVFFFADFDKESIVTTFYEGSDAAWHDLYGWKIIIIQRIFSLFYFQNWKHPRQKLGNSWLRMGNSDNLVS